MKAEHAAEMNRLSRMTREQRDESVVKELMGPWFRTVFPGLVSPDEPHPAIDGMEGEE